VRPPGPALKGEGHLSGRASHGGDPRRTTSRDHRAAILEGLGGEEHSTFRKVDDPLVHQRCRGAEGEPGTGGYVQSAAVGDGAQQGERLALARAESAARGNNRYGIRTADAAAACECRGGIDGEVGDVR